jgi:hypothetical protein
VSPEGLILNHFPPPPSILVQVDASMRRILVEWLIELYDELRLSAEVLLTAVHQVDRFLSSEVSVGQGGGKTQGYTRN